MNNKTSFYMLYTKLNGWNLTTYNFNNHTEYIFNFNIDEKHIATFKYNTQTDTIKMLKDIEEID